MIAAAGTGGHIFPGLAIANACLSRKIKVSWVGTPNGMENELVDKKKIHFYSINMSGARGKGLLNWLKIPFILLNAIYQSLLLLQKIQPKIIILMGGYICAPIAIAAKIKNIPVVIHEQNSIPGLANKYLSLIADKVFLGLKNDQLKGQVIGNPVRASIYKIIEPSQRFLKRKGALRILIIGGSLGALSFNEKIPDILSSLSKDKQFIITHQSGMKHYRALIDNYKKSKLTVSVKAFIKNIHKYYEWADIVIARAGAITVSELSISGVASILVPYPHAVDNHQYFNARLLEKKKGAQIILESEIGVELSDALKKLSRKKCIQMACNAKIKAPLDPCNQIIDYCLKNHER